MDALIIFSCIFTPTFVLNLLSAGRDQLLFESRARSSRWFVALAIGAAAAALLWVGLPLDWTLALVLAGPLGSFLGEWFGSGDWLVLRHRIGHALRRRRGQ